MSALDLITSHPFTLGVANAVVALLLLPVREDAKNQSYSLPCGAKPMLGGGKAHINPRKQRHAQN